MNLDSHTEAELEAGVSQSRLAQFAELSPSTLRGYEKDGLIPTQSRDGKKTYGLDAFKALETIKHLRAEGLSLREISERLKASPDSSPAKADSESGLTADPAAPSSTAGATTVLDSPDAAGTASAAKTEAELRAQVEQLRAQLRAERAKLERLSSQVETRIIRRRNELVLTKKELEELERLRESNIKRALDVTRRTKAIQYASTRPGVLRLEPRKPKK